MQVRTYRDGTDRTGLHIGETNAHRYFHKRASSIELRLDDLHIQCTLPPDFWQGSPEIHDPRLSEWLQFKLGRRGQGNEPMLFSMIPSGAAAFVLKPTAEPKYQAFGAEIAASRKSPSPSYVTTPLSILHSRSIA